MPRPRVSTMLALLLCAGCGASADPAGQDAPPTAAVPATTGASTTAPATPPEDLPAVEAAYRDWLDGLAAEDAGATCDAHAPGFTIELRRRAVIADRAALGDPCEDFVAILWEDPAAETEPLDIEITQQTAEDALLAVDFPEVDQTVRMVNRYGNWYVASTTRREDGPAAWTAAWCNLDLSMTREEIIGQMGEPSGEYTVANGGEPQLWWASGPYDFRVYFELDGSVAELVGDYDALLTADREQLDCPELRNRTNS